MTFILQVIFRSPFFGNRPAGPSRLAAGAKWQQSNQAWSLLGWAWRNAVLTETVGA
jgi:hypothetical protein